MLPYIATYLYTRRGNKEESIKNARNDEQKQKEKEKNENKERRIKERRKDTFF